MSESVLPFPKELVIEMWAGCNPGHPLTPTFCLDVANTMSVESRLSTLRKARYRLVEETAVDTLPELPAATVVLNTEPAPLTELERRLLSLARGPETTWVVPPVGGRTVDDQRIVRAVDGLHARGYLDLTRCGSDGEDNRYRLTDAGLRALSASVD